MKGYNISASSARAGTWGPLIGVAVFIVVIAGGCIAILNSALGPLQRSADDYLRALGASDGRAVCSKMTRIAQAELAATYKRDTCHQAVNELLKPLTAAEREQLSNTQTHSAETKPPLGYVRLGDNPLQLSQLVLTKVDGEWLVTQLR